MRYSSDIGNRQQLHIENQGLLTFVSLSSRGPNKQQSQSNAFDTGEWTQPPRLYKMQNALVLQIEADEGERFLRLSRKQLRWVERPAGLQEARAMELCESSKPSPVSPVKPLS